VVLKLRGGSVVTITDTIKSEDFKLVEEFGSDKLFIVKLVSGGKITVLDRMTGYGNGIRDIETGYRNPQGLFWLASGGCDARSLNGTTYEDVIVWVQKNANTCIGA
jgi:hypothetical protein